MLLQALTLVEELLGQPTEDKETGATDLGINLLLQSSNLLNDQGVLEVKLEPTWVFYHR